MQNQTTEFSFILKPAKYGVGVFVIHDIKKGTYLRLFGDEGKDYNTSVIRDKKDVPKDLELYCVDRGKKLSCPRDFGCMEIGWYLNHSKSPNVFHCNYNYFALKDIKAGDEIVIDYNTLEESRNAKENYYKQG